MDLIAYLFAAIWSLKWLALLAFVVWVVLACRNPIKNSKVHDQADHDLEEQRKLRASIDLTSDAFGINVRRGRQ